MTFITLLKDSSSNTGGQPTTYRFLLIASPTNKVPATTKSLVITFPSPDFQIVGGQSVTCDTPNGFKQNTAACKTLSSNRVSISMDHVDLIKTSYQIDFPSIPNPNLQRIVQKIQLRFVRKNNHLF